MSDKAAIRAKARQLREAEARRQRRREQLIRFGVVAVSSWSSLQWPSLCWPVAPPPTTRQQYPPGLRAGRGRGGRRHVGPVTVDLWIDFQCPFCRDFELTTGPTPTSSWPTAASGSSTTRSRSWASEFERAANAFGCSVDEGRPAEYLRVLYENQPPERTGGFTVDDLVAFGEQAEVTGEAFETCVTDGSYDGWVSNVAASQQDAGVTSTPTVVVDGQTLDDRPADARRRRPPSSRPRPEPRDEPGSVLPCSPPFWRRYSWRYPHRYRVRPIGLAPRPRYRCARTRCASSPASCWGSGWATVGGSPAAASPEWSATSPSGPCRSGSSVRGSYHVATDWELYFGEGGEPLEALRIWQGGLGIWGGIALGAVGA